MFAALVLGFQSADDDVGSGEVLLYPGQAHCIINISETDVSLDRCDGKGSGQRPVTSTDDSLSSEAEVKNKRSARCTLVGVSLPVPIYLVLKTRIPGVRRVGMVFWTQHEFIGCFTDIVVLGLKIRPGIAGRATCWPLARH